MNVVLRERSEGGNVWEYTVATVSDGVGTCVIGTGRSAELALPRASYLDVAQEQCLLVVRGDEIWLENRSPMTPCAIDGQALGRTRVELGAHTLVIGSHELDLVLSRP